MSDTENDVFERAAGLHHTVEVQKFSATTYPRDVINSAVGMPDEMRRLVDRLRIGQIWRARVGRRANWCYGWSAREALELAVQRAEAA